MAFGCVATVAGCQLLVGLHGVELVEPDAGADAGLDAGREAGPDAAPDGGGGPGTLGESCAPDGSCADQAVCVPQDNVCCATLCGLKCEACTKMKTGQVPGTCAPILVGEDPDNECADAGGCGVKNQCRCQDGVKDGDETDVDCGGACPPCALGKMCSQDADCSKADSSYASCVNGACCSSACGESCFYCNAAGQCVWAAGHSDPYCTLGTVCGPVLGGCASRAGGSCSNNSFCLSYNCTAGTCAKSTPGQTCNTNSDCVSGTCQNYVCM
jgi:hypothetical protein